MDFTPKELEYLRRSVVNYRMEIRIDSPQFVAQITENETMLKKIYDLMNAQTVNAEKWTTLQNWVKAQMEKQQVWNGNRDKEDAFEAVLDEMETLK